MKSTMSLSAMASSVFLSTTCDMPGWGVPEEDIRRTKDTAQGRAMRRTKASWGTVGTVMKGCHDFLIMRGDSTLLGKPDGGTCGL